MARIISRYFVPALVAGLVGVVGPSLGWAQKPVKLPAEPLPIDWQEPPRATFPRDTLLPGFLPVEEDATGLWLIEPQGLWGFSIDHYNRTDGLTLAWGLMAQSREPARIPHFGSRIATATTHQRFYWSLWAEQRLPVPGAVILTYEHFQRSSTFDDWKISVRENDAWNFFAGTDLMDWWREKGFSLSLTTESPTGRYALTATYMNATQRSERNRSPFALFSNGEDRLNPTIAEGKLKSLELGLRVDTRDIQSPLLPVPGWLIVAEWERAGGLLSGDHDFSRARIDLRRYNRLGRDAWWDWRAVWLGPVGDDSLPPQRQATLGGAGSLRGFPAATFSAAEAALASTEIRLPLPVNDRIAVMFLSWHWVAFADLGAVDDLDEWHGDVGTGISGINIFSYLGFFVAQRVTDTDLSDGGPRFIVRLRRDF